MKHRHLSTFLAHILIAVNTWLLVHMSRLVLPDFCHEISCIAESIITPEVIYLCYVEIWNECIHANRTSWNSIERIKAKGKNIVFHDVIRSQQPK